MGRFVWDEKRKAFVDTGAPESTKTNTAASPTVQASSFEEDYQARKAANAAKKNNPSYIQMRQARQNSSVQQKNKYANDAQNDWSNFLRENQEIVDQAFDQYGGLYVPSTYSEEDIPKRIEPNRTVKKPGEYQQTQQTTRKQKTTYQPLSREERDKKINAFVDATNALENGTDWNTTKSNYQAALWDINAAGGLERLLKEQQEDAANDRAYERQLRGVDISDMNVAERFGGTLGGIVKGAGKQIGVSGLGLAASSMNKGALMATEEYGPALDTAAKNWYFGLINEPGSEIHKTYEQNVRRLASYIGGDAYADAVVNRIKEEAEKGKANPNYMPYNLLEGVEADEDTLWQNLQGTISETGVYNSMRDLQESAARDIQYAKDVNLIDSKFGDMLVEAGVSTVQNAADAAMAAALGLTGNVAGMIPFALRAYGGSYAEALQQSTELGETIGKDIAKKAQQYGVVSSAIEVGTEMMWGIVGMHSKVTNGGALDDYAMDQVTKALEGFAKTERGAKILTWIGEKALGGVTEGLEEVIGDAANYILNTSGMMSGDGRTFQEFWNGVPDQLNEMTHDFVTGALGGIMGESANFIYKPMQTSQIGKQLRNGTLQTEDGTHVELDDILSLANAPGMEGTSLAQTYEDLFGGLPRNPDSFSDNELGKLYEAYEETLGKSSGALIRVNEALKKVEEGKRLTNGDVNRITQNQFAVDYLMSEAGLSEGEVSFDGNINERRSAVEMALEALASATEALDQQEYDNSLDTIKNAAEGKIQLPLSDRVQIANEIAPSMEGQQLLQNAAQQAQQKFGARDIAGNRGGLNRTQITTPNYRSGNTTSRAYNATRDLQEEARYRLADSYIRVDDTAKALGVTNENVRDVMGRMINQGQDVIDYTAEWIKYMNQGKKKQDLDLSSESILTPQQKQAAWNEGRLATIKEEANARAAEVRLRKSSERDDGQGASRQAGGLAQSTGQNQSGDIATEPADRGAASVTVGTQEVTARDLGLATGTSKGKAYVVTGNYTEDMNEGVRIAKEHGMEVVYYAKGNGLGYLTDEKGEFPSVLINGNKIIARCDDPVYTASQFVIHEATHDDIDKGKINVDEIWDERSKGLTGEELDRLSQMYAESMVYEDEDGNIGQLYSDREIKTEIVCDAMARMNVIHGYANQKEAAPIYSKVRENAIENKMKRSGNETRGQPTEGAKFSRAVAAASKVGVGVDQATESAAPGATPSFDSAGNELTPSQAAYFSESTVRDKKGRLKVMYHGTNSEFFTFKRGDIGFHFGNKSTARTRAGRGKTSRLMEVYLNVTNPIVMDEDLGSWDADYRLTQKLYERGIITKEEALDVLRTQSGYKRSTGDANTRLRNVLSAKGYDGISYPNHFESSGSTSYIAFESNQAKLTSNLNPSGTSDIRFSRATWNASEYVTAREEAAEALAEALDISVDAAEAYIDSVNGVAKYIADHAELMDYVSSPGRSSFVSNSEYGGSFDFSTLCKKRRLMTGTMSAIQNALPDAVLTPVDFLKIRQMMLDAGLEASCGLCYVEGSRAGMGQFTKEFLKLYAKYNPGKWVPTQAQMSTPDSIEDIRINHPEVYAEYEKFWNNHGKLRDSDPNLFASQQKPKLYQMRTAYDGEILKYFKKDSTIETKNRNGGVRLQSFSDFEIVHLIDTMQIIMDMSRVGLAGQAYTKVPDFALALGNTGLKINLSLITKGVDSNGKLIFDDREGMNHETAFKIRDQYSKNVGTILVTFTDDQLKAAMADDRIDFIIPFHRSQWKKSQYGAMGLPANTKDYTYQQNEKWIDPKKHTHVYAGREVPTKVKNYMPNEWWQPELSGKENAEYYLDMCAKDGKRPKFYKLLDFRNGRYYLKADGSTDGYWKLLIDFKMYDNDGNFSPQVPVRPDFNMKEANRMMEEYKGGHERFPVAHGIVDQFVSEYKKNHKQESSRATSVNFEYMKSFAEQIEDFMDKERRRELFGKDGLLIGTTPQILQDIGLIRMPVAIDQEHVSYALDGSYSGDQRYIDNHTFAPEEFAKLPEKLADPIAVIADLNKNDLIVYVDMVNKNGTQTIMPFRIESGLRFGGNAKDIQRIKSVYGNETAENDLINAITKDSDEKIRLYYLNKNKIPPEIEKVVRKSGVLVPSGIIHKITDNGSVVKPKIADSTKTQQFRNWFGKSKAVNKAGDPLILYHWTNAEFTAFDTSRSGKNQGKTHGDGIYLSSSQNEFSYAGKKRMDVYASIKNPFEMQMTEAQANQIYEKYFAPHHEDRFGSYRPNVVAKLQTRTRVFDYLREAAETNNTTTSAILSELGYDGVHDGIEWVAFSPTQVKSANDNIGIYDKNNPDIRFSRAVATPETIALANQNKELQKDLSELRQLLKARTAQKEYWKGQTKVTQGRQIRQEDVTRLAKDLLKSQNSSADVEAVAAKLKALGEYILNVTEEQGETFYDDVRMKSYEIAHDILNDAKVLKETGGEHFFPAFQDRLKSMTIYVPVNVRNDISPDGWNALRSRVKGITKVTADPSKGMSIEDAYSTLQSEFDKEGSWLLPSYDFNGQANLADEFEQIMRVVDEYMPVYENLNSYEMAEAAEWTANEIMTRIISNEIRETNPTYADKMEKKLADQKLKTQEALRKVREQRDRRVENLKEHYQEMAQNRRERKADSDARTRLLKIAKRLNNKKLTRVQRSLLDEYIRELDLVAKSITKTKIADLKALEEQYKAYEAAQGENFIPDKVIEKKLERLSKKQINDLTQEEVLDLTTVLLNFENMIRTENELIDSQIRKDIYAAGEQTIEDIRNSNGKTGFLNKYISTETATPEREVHRITGYRDSSPLYQATKELSAGQRKMLDYQRRAEKLFKKWTTDKAFTRSIAGKRARMITVKGVVNGELTDVKITPAMLMALYLHEQNDDNMTHIAKGGVKIPDMELYKKGKIKQAYENGTKVIFTRGMIKEMTSQLTADERAFADVVHAYYNGMSRESINDVSEKLKGYSIAGVEHYYPLDVDGTFLNKEFDQLKRDGSIEGMGFLKERQSSVKPIMLYDMNDTLAKSISQHSKYYGLAIPVRNFQKLWSMQTSKYADEKTSVQEVLGQEWGGDATNYIAKMMTDLQNGTGLKDDAWGDLLARARSHYAGAVLNTNASVALKQAASYPTAAAVVGYGPLAKALADKSKIDLDKLAEYTPLLWYRMKGFVDPELGEIGKNGGHIPQALNWIQAIDVATTTKLAKAAMYYVNENNKDLARGTDAWWREVANVYNRIIEETQPNYTMMQRPQILRSDNALTRALNMFKTQPFQNFNILYDAFGNLAAKTREYKAVATEENLNKLNEARKTAARAVSSQLISAFVFSLMQFAWDAFRGKTKKYKDDDDEMTLASWLKGMGINVLSSAGGMIPFGGYALELAETMTDAVLKAFGKDPFFDQKFYGLSENAAESFNDMGNALINMVTKIAQAMEGGEIKESTIRSIVDGAADIAQFAGIPANNVIKLFQAVARNTFLASDGKYIGGYKALRVTTDPAKYSSDYYDLLYKAYQQDPKAYQEVLQMMLNDGSGVFTEEKVKTNMEKRMKQSQGVDKVGDLDQRWMLPDQQAAYDKGLADISGNKIWLQATDEQQQKIMDQLYDIAVGNASGQKLEEKIKAGAGVGIDQTEFLLYQIALQQNDADGNGSYKQAEAEAAIRSMTGLTQEEQAYLFDMQFPTAKKNPFRVTRGGSVEDEINWAVLNREGGAHGRRVAGNTTSSWNSSYTPKQGNDISLRGDGLYNGLGISQQGAMTEKRAALESSVGADFYRKAWEEAGKYAVTSDDVDWGNEVFADIANGRMNDYTGKDLYRLTNKTKAEPSSRMYGVLEYLSQVAYAAGDEEKSDFYMNMLWSIDDMDDKQLEEFNKYLRSLGF